MIPGAIYQRIDLNLLNKAYFLLCRITVPRLLLHHPPSVSVSWWPPPHFQSDSGRCLRRRHRRRLCRQRLPASFMAAIVNI